MYFLSQLPLEVGTVGEAFDCVVPGKVRRYREIPGTPPDRRQGNWFFLPTEYETRHLPRPSYRGVLDYCQAVRREAMQKTGYPEEFDHIATSDVEFVKRLNAQQGITAVPLA